MTPEQSKDAERLARYIVREGLSSRMNDTKWRETLGALRGALGSGVEFRVKDVRWPAPSGWDRDFPYSVPHFEAIEWLDVRVSGDEADAVAAALGVRNVPFLREPDRIRIEGYTRPGRGSA